jgi:hypothetical protein
MKRVIVILMLVSLSSGMLPSQSTNTSSMQQFLLIFRFKSNFVPSSRQVLQANIRRWQDYMNELGQSGELVTALRPSTEGRTISGTRKEIKDSSYIANNELVSSCIVVKVSSMDEASEIAKKCPIFEFDGSVEIRPLEYTSH